MVAQAKGAIFVNCNWGTCIAPPTRRPRAHPRANPVFLAP